MESRTLPSTSNVFAGDDHMHPRRPTKQVNKWKILMIAFGVGAILMFIGVITYVLVRTSKWPSEMGGDKTTTTKKVARYNAFTIRPRVQDGFMNTRWFYESQTAANKFDDGQRSFQLMFQAKNTDERFLESVAQAHKVNAECFFQSMEQTNKGDIERIDETTTRGYNFRDEYHEAMIRDSVDGERFHGTTTQAYKVDGERDLESMTRAFLKSITEPNSVDIERRYNNLKTQVTNVNIERHHDSMNQDDKVDVVTEVNAEQVNLSMTRPNKVEIEQFHESMAPANKANLEGPFYELMTNHLQTTSDYEQTNRVSIPYLTAIVF